MIGAASGLFSSAAIDVNAWAKSQSKYDWILAIKRWVAGAITGAITAVGISITDR